VVTVGKFRLHYAWVVLFAACMLNIANRTDHGSFGVFVEPLVERFGWSRHDISAAYSIASIVELPVILTRWFDHYMGLAVGVNCTWTLLGVPCLNVRYGTGPNRLPSGVQLIDAARSGAAIPPRAHW
jgi:hypothetical protein